MNLATDIWLHNEFLQILHEPIRGFPGTCLKVEVENLPIFRFTRLPRCWQPRWIWKGEGWYHLNKGSWWIYQPKHHALWMGKSLKITFAMVGFPAKWVIEWSLLKLLNYGHTKELAHSCIALWCAFVIYNRYLEVPKFQVSSPCSICHLVTLITSWPILMPLSKSPKGDRATELSNQLERSKKGPGLCPNPQAEAIRSPRWLHWWSGWSGYFLGILLEGSGISSFLMKVKQWKLHTSAHFRGSLNQDIIDVGIWNRSCLAPPKDQVPSAVVFATGNRWAV